MDAPHGVTKRKIITLFALAWNQTIVRPFPSHQSQVPHTNPKVQPADDTTVDELVAGGKVIRQQHDMDDTRTLP